MVNDVPGRYMLEDLKGQSAAIDAVVKRFFIQAEQLDRVEIGMWFSKEVLFTGCGATYALALTTASLYQKQGIRSSAVPASEIYFYPQTIPERAETLIAFSRSGETSETLKSVEQFRHKKSDGKVIAITANIRSSLALSSDLVLDCSDVGEASIIETRSFSGMFVLAQLLIAWQQKNTERLDELKKIPDDLDLYNNKVIDISKRIAADRTIERFIFLGGGPLFGIAYQASLTFKECLACWAEAFHPLEFRHGPRTTATLGAFVCLFASENDEIAKQEKLVLTEMKDQGASILVFDEKQRVFNNFQENERSIIDPAVTINYRLILVCLIFSQWLAYFKSLSAGVNPDQPANLKAVTRL
jgi:glucosamine--fructose-6-phosphate aminotransferase (isomerizing)